jgi:hypothetical protein
VPKNPRNELPAQPLSPLIVERSELVAQATIRRDPNINLKIHFADQAEYLAQGWSVEHPGAKSVRISKPKNHDALLGGPLLVPLL